MALSGFGFADGDQSLVAEPGFHGESPERSGAKVKPVRRASDSLPKVMEQQSERADAASLALSPAAWFPLLRSRTVAFACFSASEYVPELFSIRRPAACQQTR